MDLTTLFCHIDDFWQAFQPVWEEQLLASGERQRQRRTQLSMREIMTLVILFHQSGFRTFKTFYCQYVRQYVRQYLGDAFPELVSYNRFVELQSRAVVPLAAHQTCSPF